MEINDLFYIVIFLSIIGSMACILLLFIERVTRLSLPFMVYLSIVFFYAVPLTMPDVTLFYHEPMRIETFKIAALVWIIGLGILAVFMISRVFIVHRMISKYAVWIVQAIFCRIGQATQLDYQRTLRIEHG